MNKRIIALLLAGIMLLCVGCGKDNVDPNETTPSAENQVETEATVENESDETVPGTAQNELSPDGFEEEETTESTGGVTDSDNSGDSNSGGDNTEKPTNPQPTEPGATEPETTEPEITEPETTEPSSGIQYSSYEAYNNMTPQEQLDFYNQFPSMEAFVKWYNEAKAEYDKEHGSVEIEDDNIDLGDIVNP